MKKRVLPVILAFCLMASLAACSDGKETPCAKDLSTERETKFGGAYLCMTIEDFCGLGFAYGDSVDISFSNGYQMEDVPFYNGYYTRAGEPLLCAYPGYPYVKACINSGEDLYELAALTDGCTASVTLHECGKYLSVQNAMNMVYTNERGDYESDEVFANFRAMCGGELEEGLFFRAASPCDDQYDRAAYSGRLCEKAGIGFILDLADSEEELAGYFGDDELDSPYWKSLYASGGVLPLNMTANYRSEAYAQSAADAMRAVLREEGPYLIHCTEGKDRTGFVCLLIEALSGASVEELESDYMKTYENYYGITKASSPESYEAIKTIKFDDMVSYLTGTGDIGAVKSEELVAGAEEYLSFGGMGREEIALLREEISTHGG